MNLVRWDSANQFEELFESASRKIFCEQHTALIQTSKRLKRRQALDMSDSCLYLGKAMCVRARALLARRSAGGSAKRIFTPSERTCTGPVAKCG